MFGRAAAFFIWKTGIEDFVHGTKYVVYLKTDDTKETFVAQIVSSGTFAPCLPNSRKNGFGV
jgi:hypothetical protein